MNAKKPTTRGRPAAKAGAKATAAKNPTAKAVGRKPANKTATKAALVKRTSAKANAKQSNAQTISDPLANATNNAGVIDKQVRRPEDNTLPNAAYLTQVRTYFKTIKDMVEEFAQHLRPLDRRRLNGVGMKKMGFIEKAYDLASDNQEFLPHWLTLGKFAADNDRFNMLEEVLALAKQVEELLWNITIESSDILYTDALEFYSSVQDAARRRIDAAEAPYNLLKPFFSRMGHSQAEGEEPTDRQAVRDFNAYLHGRKDGEITVVNVSPKVSAGKREIIDKKFADSEQFKATEEAEIKE